MMGKPILCLDFDGVLHSYTSGWQGADVVPDPPTPGAMAFLISAVDHFEVHIFSSRTGQSFGVSAMQNWLKQHMLEHCPAEIAHNILGLIQWPREKPPAMVTLDDRALTFRGSWPTMRELLDFKPWNKGGLTDPCGYCIDGLQADGETPCPCQGERHTGGMLDVIAERRRQHAEFGDLHDNAATRGQLAIAGLNYAAAGLESARDVTDAYEDGGMFVGLALKWPWDVEWWKPKGRRRNLVKAAALLVAEIDRLDRAEAGE